MRMGRKSATALNQFRFEKRGGRNRAFSLFTLRNDGSNLSKTP